jgi:NADPH-dependent glutamate synthase beta subunit-like oxidoreductase
VKGRATTAEGAPIPGLYVSGWLKRGPTGIIGTNIPDARETVASILEDVKSGSLPSINVPEASIGIDGVRSLLKSKGITKANLITWDGFRKIDTHEVSAGQTHGKPREKLVHIADMINIANN